MTRTDILCPECLKAKIMTETYHEAFCDECGEQYIITAPMTVRYVDEDKQDNQNKNNNN